MISVGDCDWYTWTTCCQTFFSLLFKNELNINDMTPRNIYHFPFPIYSQQTLDIAAVYENAGKF